MCLGIPLKIVQIGIDGDSSVAIGEIGEVKQKINISLVDVSVGDYVIVHAGFAITKLNEEEAKETLDLIAEMIESA